jgi:cytochrome c553
MKKLSTNKKLAVNAAFLILCASILIILLKAPEETTSHLPHDENHNRFYAIKDKKEAETYCLNCHAADKEAPLAATHPPKYRCLFCHKRQ